jgi:hypothetical protein
VPVRTVATSIGELARTICRLQRIARTSADAEARVVRILEVGRPSYSWTVASSLANGFFEPLLTACDLGIQMRQFSFFTNMNSRSSNG